jgi:hypothetical protein
LFHYEAIVILLGIWPPVSGPACMGDLAWSTCTHICNIYIINYNIYIYILIACICTRVRTYTRSYIYLAIEL